MLETTETDTAAFSTIVQEMDYHEGTGAIYVAVETNDFETTGGLNRLTLSFTASGVQYNNIY